MASNEQFVPSRPRRPSARNRRHLAGFRPKSTPAARLLWRAFFADPGGGRRLRVDVDDPQRARLTVEVAGEGELSHVPAGVPRDRWQALDTIVYVTLAVRNLPPLHVRYRALRLLAKLRGLTVFPAAHASVDSLGRVVVHTYSEMMRCNPPTRSLPRTPSPN